MKLLIMILSSLIIVTQASIKCHEFKNTVWHVLSTNCGNFCADINRDVKCEWWRKSWGCYCESGYFRSVTLDCVKPEQCFSEVLGIPEIDNEPQYEEVGHPDSQSPHEAAEQCPASESKQKCSSRCLELCKNREDPISCPINCEDGCFCKGNQLRNNRGVCVPVQECEPIPERPPDSPPKCPEGEKFKECGNKCEEMCHNMASMGKTLKCQLCIPGCFCKSGLFRTAVGTCVEGHECNESKFSRVLTKVFGVFKRKRVIPFSYDYYREDY